MKKSKKVTLTLCTAAAAAAIAACNRTREAEVQRCIDDHNVMALDRNCEKQTPPPGSGSSGSGASSGEGPSYRWVYGGNGGYAPGSIVYDAHDAPTDGLGSVRTSTLAASGYSEGGARVGIAEGGGFTAPPSSRGGFGSSRYAFAGEGAHGEGGGHGAGE